MRLDEWQKWLDSQFLDTAGNTAEPQDAAEPAPQTIVPEPPTLRDDSAPTPPAPETARRLAEPAAESPGPPAAVSPLGSLADEMEVPSIERYLPFLRGRAPAQEPAPAPPAAEAGPEAPGETTAMPAAEEPAAATAAESLPGPPAPAEDASGPSPEPAATPDAGAAGEEPAADSDAMTEPRAASEQPAPGRRRFGVSHRRARHARNVRPVEIGDDSGEVSLWSLVPKHIQVLVAMGSDEVAQNSYKRSFRESRVELIQRLLDPTLSLEDTARLLNVCPTTVRRYTNRGLLTHQRTTGDQRRFKLSDVLAFLEAQSRIRP